MPSGARTPDRPTRLLGELESLTRELEIALAARDWRTLDHGSARAGRLSQGIATLSATDTLDANSPEIRERARRVIERHGHCLNTLRAASATLRADLSRLDQLESTAHAVLPKYQVPSADRSAGNHLAGAA